MTLMHSVRGRQRKLRVHGTDSGPGRTPQWKRRWKNTRGELLRLAPSEQEEASVWARKSPVDPKIICTLTKSRSCPHARQTLLPQSQFEIQQRAVHVLSKERGVGGSRH